jgi:protein SCO1/2
LVSSNLYPPQSAQQRVGPAGDSNRGLHSAAPLVYRTRPDPGLSIMRTLNITLILALGLLAGACRQSPQWYGSDVTGTMPDLAFTLTGTDGRPVTATDLRGEPVLLFFGFTHCPDVCPTTLAQLKAAMQALGPDSNKIRVAFVTVDPERDTAAVMRRYTAAFGPWLIGLTGSDEALARLRKTYGVYASMEPGDGSDGYNIMHTPIVFVFDAKGRIRLLIKDTSNTDAVVSDIRNLLDSE